MPESHYRSDEPGLTPEGGFLTEEELHNGHPINEFLWRGSLTTWRAGYNSAVMRCERARVEEAGGKPIGFDVWNGNCGHVWRKDQDGDQCPRCRLETQVDWLERELGRANASADERAGRAELRRELIRMAREHALAPDDPGVIETAPQGKREPTRPHSWIEVGPVYVPMQGLLMVLRCQDPVCPAPEAYITRPVTGA